MKFIQSSTLIHNDEHDLLVRAFGHKLDAVIEQQFEFMLEELVKKAEKVLDARNELYNDDEIA